VLFGQGGLNGGAAYVNLGEALAADKAAEGSAAWSALVTTLPALEAAQASAAAPLKAAIDGVGALPPGDIAALRAALNATFKPMRALLQANAGGGDEKVVVTYCPMKSAQLGAELAHLLGAWQGGAGLAEALAEGGDGAGALVAGQQGGQGAPQHPAGDPLLKEAGGGVFEVVALVDDQAIEAGQDALAGQLFL